MPSFIAICVFEADNSLATESILLKLIDLEIEISFEIISQKSSNNSLI